MRRALVLVPLILATSIQAHAEPEAPKPFDPAATVSVEPIFLLAGIVEANLEIKAAPHVGVQVLGGYGGFVGGTIKELGTEANIYVRPQLAGLHFGAMGKKLWASTSLPFIAMDNSGGTERELGVYAGWKWIGWRHLTAVLQVGVGRIDLSPATDVKSPQVIPVANFVAGYSF